MIGGGTIAAVCFFWYIYVPRKDGPVGKIIVAMADDSVDSNRLSRCQQHWERSLGTDEESSSFC